MKLDRIERMVGGWFIGNFEPTSYKTDNFEVSYKLHPKDQQWDIHYHTDLTEINLVLNGRMIIQNKELTKGDIFILYPYEIADPVFLEDTEIVCVKTPSLNDKVSVLKK